MTEQPGAGTFQDPGLELLYRFVNPQPSGPMIAAVLWLQEISQIAYTVHEPSVAETKLNWWRQEWQRLREGQARHPYTQPLQQHSHHNEVQHWAEDCHQAVICIINQEANTNLDNMRQRCQQIGQFATALAPLMGVKPVENDSSLEAHLWGEIWLMEQLGRAAQGCAIAKTQIPLDAQARHDDVHDAIRSVWAQAQSCKLSTPDGNPGNPLRRYLAARWGMAHRGMTAHISQQKALYRPAGMWRAWRTMRRLG